MPVLVRYLNVFFVLNWWAEKIAHPTWLAEYQPVSAGITVATVAVSEQVLFKSDKGTVCSEQLINITARRLAAIKTPLYNVVGGFANDNYWSSSENDSNNA